MEALAIIASLPHSHGCAPESITPPTPAVVVVLRSYLDELDAARAEIARLRAVNATLGKTLAEMFQIALVP